MIDMSNKEAVCKAFEQAKMLFMSKNMLTLSARLAALTALENAIRRRQKQILAALHSDLGKCAYEAYMTEVGLTLAELCHVKKHLRRWMKPKRVKSSLAQLPGKTRLYADPRGVVLIMSPWNYPFLLTIDPLIGALAAGNTVIVKPSACSPATSQTVADICTEAFPNNEVQVIQGGRKENQALLDMPFDYIFFTGSPEVGKIVMAAAAKNLTPLTLELGGKSPVIIDRGVDLQKTAKRILFGKLLNAGQTCVAPDYVLVCESDKDAFLTEIASQAKTLFKDESTLSTWPKIVSSRHFDRLMRLIDGENIVCGGRGNRDTRQIDFTILDEPKDDAPVMHEEIFGPILPVLTYSSLDRLIDRQKRKPKPLALYLFTNDQAVKNKILTELSFGGGCINDTVMHLSSSHAPFGGVGNSGIGQYHGKYSFETFSHRKTVLERTWTFDLPVRHRPYKDPDKTLPEQLLR